MHLPTITCETRKQQKMANGTGCRTLPPPSWLILTPPKPLPPPPVLDYTYPPPHPPTTPKDDKQIGTLSYRQQLKNKSSRSDPGIKKNATTKTAHIPTNRKLLEPCECTSEVTCIQAIG